MRTREISPSRLLALRGTRSREVIAHEMRKRGHGTDAKSIWRYETGRSQPNARILADYADVLGASTVDDLYGDDDEESHQLPSYHELLAALAPLGELFSRSKVSA